MWQLLKKTGLIVFSSLFILITGIWLSEAAAQPTSNADQKISEDIKEEVDRFCGQKRVPTHVLAAHILERVYKTEPEKRQEYITAIKEYPAPKVRWYREGRRIIVEFLLELLENPEEAKKYFERLEAKKAGKVKVSPEVRKRVKRFFKSIRSPDPEEREEAYMTLKGFRKKDAGLEYVIALKEHPWPEDKEARKLLEETVEYFKKSMDSDHFLAEVQPRIEKYREETSIAKVEPQIEAFFAGIVSNTAWERKEAIWRALSPFLSKHGWAIIEDRPKQCIRAIRTHTWPEDNETQRKIEMVLEVLKDKDQEEFPLKEQEQLSSTAEELGIAEEEAGGQSLKDAVAYYRFDERILRDKAANPFVRKVLAQHIAHLHMFVSSRFAQEEWGGDEETRKGIAALREETESLFKDEDETVSLLMHMGMAIWRLEYIYAGVVPDIKSSIPHFIQGLENDYLYFRLLSQEYLEEFTGQRFDLDPTDPPEIRAPGIEKWREWWRDNKYDLYYDPWSERLLPRRPQRRPEGQITTQ